MSAVRGLNLRPSGEGRLPLPERCSLDVSCFEESEVQEALALAIEDTLYVVALAGIELHALDGVTVAPDCRAAACALQNLPEGQVPLEMNPQPDAMEMARTVAVRREGDLRFHIVLRTELALMSLSPDAVMRRICVGFHRSVRPDLRSHLQHDEPVWAGHCPTRRGVADRDAGACGSCGCVPANARSASPQRRVAAAPTASTLAVAENRLAGFSLSKTEARCLDSFRPSRYELRRCR